MEWLHEALADACGARIVSLSSSGHLLSPVVFDDLAFDFIPYSPIGAYGQSKTATALLAVGATQRWADQGIFANAVNPGAIPAGLQKFTGGLKTPVERRKTPEQGAATSVLAATSRCWTASADGISRIAARRSRSADGPATSAAGSRRTRSTRTTRSDCGTSLCGNSVKVIVGQLAVTETVPHCTGRRLQPQAPTWLQLNSR